MSLSVFGGNSSYKEKEIDSIRYVIFYEGMSPHVHVKNQYDTLRDNILVFLETSDH